MANMFTDHTGAGGPVHEELSEEDKKREEVFRMREQARRTRTIRGQDILKVPSGMSEKKLEEECSLALSSICAPDGTYDPQVQCDAIASRSLLGRLSLPFVYAHRMGPTTHMRNTMQRN
jgi:hypothetical protein